MGSYGVVYKANWRDTVVAVKKMHEMNMDAKSLDDFKREAKLLELLNPHPNVVLFLGITSPPQPLAIITEFCAGGSLWSHLQTNAKVSLEEQNKIFHGVLLGILHLESENIVHRDLAARNVLLTEDFDVKVTDFGLSRYGRENESHTTKSDVGPIKWMAPECIRDRLYSFKSDVWAFGVLMWEVVCREEPFLKMNTLDVAMGVCFNNMRLKIPENCNPLFAKIMKECWESDPENRPSFKQIYSEFNWKEESSSKSTKMSQTNIIKAQTRGYGYISGNKESFK